MATRTSADIESFHARILAYWDARGGRQTPVRTVLSRLVAEQTVPFEPEELLAQARRIDRAISLASVYRALRNLVDAGLLREFVGSGKTHCYTLVETPNAGMSNIVCTDCEQVIPMADECLPLREGFLARQLGFQPQKMSLRIEASCDELRQTGVCPRCKTQPKARA